MQTASTRPEHTPTPIRCVLLCLAPRTPADLDESMRKRNLAPTRCASAFMALAELCAERVPVALIVVEPDTIPGVGDLVDAATRYAPYATLWRYDASSPQRLRAFEIPSVRASAPAPAPSVARATPRLRLAAIDDAPPATSGASGGASAAPSRPPASLLSEDELSMLLSDDPRDAEGRAR